MLYTVDSSAIWGGNLLLDSGLVGLVLSLLVGLAFGEGEVGTLDKCTRTKLPFHGSYKTLERKRSSLGVLNKPFIPSDK